MGVCWPTGQPEAGDRLEEIGRAEDVVSDSHYAWAATDGETVTLSRDPLGVSPLYYGRDAQGRLCFASEDKGLVAAVEEIRELPPGNELRGEQPSRHFTLTERDPLDMLRQEVAAELRKRLEAAVAERAGRGVPFGSWLSGGLDSSAAPRRMVQWLLWHFLIRMCWSTPCPSHQSIRSLVVWKNGSYAGR